MQDKKVLVVYFSATGTTRQVAELLVDAANADLCEIEPVQQYTAADLNWHNPQSRSSVEMNDSLSRPAIKAPSVDISKYDCIYLGYPIWWDLAPRAVYSFIESHNLKGKTIIPFATSGGSAIGTSVADFKLLYPEVNWQAGKMLTHASKKEIAKWCNK